MCGSRKCYFSPNRRDLKFLGVKGVGGSQSLIFVVSRGVGVLGQVPSVGEVWIIYGTTQSCIPVLHVDFH